MSTVSVPVEVLLWVEVEDGTDAEVTERAYEAVENAVPGMDAAASRTLFAPDVDSKITYVTMGEPKIALAVSYDGSKAVPRASA